MKRAYRTDSHFPGSYEDLAMIESLTVYLRDPMFPVLDGDVSWRLPPPADDRPRLAGRWKDWADVNRPDSEQRSTRSADQIRAGKFPRYGWHYIRSFRLAPLWVSPTTWRVGSCEKGV